MNAPIRRRDVLRGAGGLGLLLAIGGQGVVALAQEAKPANPLIGNSLFTTWLRIEPTGKVVLIHAEVEYGQGTSTSNAMLVAEELDIAWDSIVIEVSDAAKVYANPRSRRLSTDGSYGMRGRYDQLRTIGATAREMLKAAAARQWGVPVADLTTADGVVKHQPSGRTAPYVSLASAAAALPIPPQVALRPVSAWRLAGQARGRIDNVPKCTGKARYALDARRPGMLHAAIARCPVPEGKVRNFDATAARKRAGVRDVVDMGFGVAVLADSPWVARKAAGELMVEWDEGRWAKASSAALAAHYTQALDTQTGAVAKQQGDYAAAAATPGATILKADYTVPFLAHMCTEPTNAVAWFHDGVVEYWTPTASMENVLANSKWLLGLEEDKVVMHRADYVGGSFGLRGRVDAELEAAWLSRHSGRPVSVVRTREEDTANGWYRPYQKTRFEVALGPDGAILGWKQTCAVQAINAHYSDELARFGVDMEKVNAANRAKSAFYRMPVDFYATSGSITSSTYAVPTVLVSGIEMQAPLGVIHWRSVGYSGNMFGLEAMVDELAQAAGLAPIAYRRRLYAGKARPLAVLDRLEAEMGKGSPQGAVWGVAFGESFDSFSAAAIAVRLVDKKIAIERVVMVCDQGQTINPDQTMAQIEGSVMDGLATALWGEITFENGRVIQSNYTDYRILTLREMPGIEAHILPSTEKPGSLTEAVTPMIMPALANAVSGASGSRIRELPLSRAGYDLA